MPGGNAVTSADAMRDLGPPRSTDSPLLGSNLPRVLAVYEALGRRDWIELQRRVATDVVLTLGGRSRFSGTYRGMGSVLALAGRLEEHLMPGESTLEDIRDEGHVIRATVTVLVVRRDDGHMRATLHERFRFDDRGLVREVAIEAEDQAEVDRFLEP
jgi:ketosteroid isomerase-like protein